MSAERLTLESADLAWGTSERDGVQIKPLASGLLNGTEIAVVRLAAGKSLETAPGEALEVVVLEGEWRLPEGVLTSGGYTRRPQLRAEDNRSERGCTLFVRRGPFAAGDPAIVFAPLSEEEWLPGQGNLRVRPLHQGGTEGTALVHWPAGERFVPHRHWGGEEIFVLSGVFEDEHGRYPTGTWILSPHLSAHHPFVREETVIFVKTGHVPARAPDSSEAGARCGEGAHSA